MFLRFGNAAVRTQGVFFSEIMHFWLQIILVSYFILSISNLVDKIFLSNIVTASVVYAIWVSILSIVAIVLLMIGQSLYGQAVYSLIDRKFALFLITLGKPTLMGPWYIVLAIFIGFLFTLAIYLLYTALQKGEASRVIPLIGGSMPVLIFCMTFFYDPLGTKKFIAFIFLVAGTVLISFMPRGPGDGHKKNGNMIAFAASLSFALFFVLSQYLFRQQGFINGLVWPRLGSILALVFLFSQPSIRRLMSTSLKPLSTRMRTIWLAGQGLGAIGFLGQQYVISIPNVSVALTSALQSVQYVFILFFATFISLYRPKLLKENISFSIVVQKILALVCIGIGLYFVAI